MAQKPTNHSDRRRCGLQRPHPIHSAVQPKKTDFPESGANPTWQRKQRKIGSKVEVYSSSAKTWYEGDITRIINDAEGEWLEVQYASRMMRLKQIFRDDITAIRPPSTKTMPISQQTTSTSSSSSQSQPTQPTHHQNHHELEQKHSDDAVVNLMGMGFEKEQCLRALCAASNNADQQCRFRAAVHYLLNGIPQKVQPPKQSEDYQMAPRRRNRAQMAPRRRNRAQMAPRRRYQELERAASVIAAKNVDPSPVFETLRSVAKKLLEDDPKLDFRTLDTRTPKMIERLIGFEGVLDFLRLLGFECDHTRTKLVCEEKPLVLTVNNAVDVLDKFLVSNLQTKGRIIDDDSVSEDSEPRRVCAPVVQLRHLASMAKYDEEVVGSPSLITRTLQISEDTPAGPDDEMYIDDQEGMNVQEDTNGGDSP